MAYMSYPQYSSDLNGTQYQYREFHNSLISSSPVSKGRIFSGKDYSPEAPVAEGNLEGYKTIARPRSSYAVYETYNRTPFQAYPNLPNRLAYHSFQNFDSRYSLMNQPVVTSRPLSGTGTFTAVEAGNTYTRTLGGIQWVDEDQRRENSVVGVNNLFTGEQNVQVSYPYSSRATRASYGDVNLVGEKFWRDPYVSGAYGRSYGR